MFDFKSIANPELSSLQPYQPGKPIAELAREKGLTDIIKLASNENPLGVSPLALSAAREFLPASELYPDGSGFELKQALAQKWSINPSEIILGNGSENIVAMMIQTFVREGEEVIISEYAFSAYAIQTKALRGIPIIVKSKAMGHDLPAMAKAVTAKTKLIFVANPNNPTNTWCTENELVEFLQSIPPTIMVVLDEAYYEYVQEKNYPNALKLRQLFPNLVITRTFSKIYGLAGMRIGYGISHPEVADLLNRVRLPFNVSSIALVAAVAALRDDEHLQASLLTNAQGKEQLGQFFKEKKRDFLPSVTNFLTIDMGQEALPIYEKLLASGIIVRPLLAYGLPNHLRITVGTSQQNQRLIEELSGEI